ncbi:MAG: ABC transporter substrate-binding protein [Planctomycetota bacterium]|nr:MAG: ABC transporter substrate-binding protein [Planctomycetota bacterium]
MGRPLASLATALGVLLLASAVANAAPRVVRYPRGVSENDTRSAYFVELLRLALDKTAATDGPVRLEPSRALMRQGRALASLARRQHIDVAWSMTSREREALVRPVRIPLLKGLLGYRVLLVRKGEAARFASIEDLAGLRRLRAGQGADWPDVQILEANGLPVVKSSSYEGLFGMLARGRFDYLPRGVTEVWEELRTHATLPIELEPHLLLHYPSAIYFFVAKDDTALAERLERGLRAALADGSFDALLRSHPATRPAFERTHFERRRILELTNPLLPEQTPLDDERLWFHPPS